MTQTDLTTSGCRVCRSGDHCQADGYGRETRRASMFDIADEQMPIDDLVNELLMACSHWIFQGGYGGAQGNFKTASLGRHPGGH